MITIYVATRNPFKFITVQRVFKEFFDAVEVVAVDVEPRSREALPKEEVMKIAQDQINYLKKETLRYDYLISCNRMLTSKDGLFSAEVVLIEDKEGRQRWGISRTVEYSAIKAYLSFEGVG